MWWGFSKEIVNYYNPLTVFTKNTLSLTVIYIQLFFLFQSNSPFNTIPWSNEPFGGVLKWNSLKKNRLLFKILSGRKGSERRTFSNIVFLFCFVSFSNKIWVIILKRKVEYICGAILFVTKRYTWVNRVARWSLRGFVPHRCSYKLWQTFSNYWRFYESFL